MRVPRQPLLVDVLLAAVLTALTLVTLTGQAPGATPARTLLAVLSVAPVAVRQRFPVLSTAAIAAAIAGYALLGYGDPPSNALGLVIAMFTVAMLRPRPVAAAVFLLAMAVFGVVYLTAPEDVLWSQIVQAAVIIAVAWILGESTRRWASRAERAAVAADRAVSQERIRIARELHDVVSHHMSVISLQAGLAGYVIDSDPATARAAIRTAGDASREALTEMRRMLGALRLDDDAAAYRPQPGLADLGGLLDRVRSAGVEVDLEVDGPVRELPAGPDLCAYRVVQESLTNVVKHARPAHARVRTAYGPDEVTITVEDDGPGGHPASPAGQGIRGMRERAELYGGTLAAGPRPGGGFAVRLRLPLREPA